MQSLNQCTSLCWPNVVLGMEASTLWSRIKRGLCGSDVEMTLCQARSTPTGTKVTSELSKSDFVLLYLSFHWRPSVFTHFLVPKKTFEFFFGCSRESRIQSRIMVHWIPSLLFFPRTRITFNKLCSKPKTTPEKEEWKIPQKPSRKEKKTLKNFILRLLVSRIFFGSRFGAWKRNECLLWDCLLRFSRVLCLK